MAAEANSAVGAASLWKVADRIGIVIVIVAA
jgi:hypothetical protein